MCSCRGTGWVRRHTSFAGSFIGRCSSAPNATSRCTRVPSAGRCRPPHARLARASGRILEAERLALIVVGEGLGVTPPADDGAQRLFGGILGHVILEFVHEAPLRRRVTRALIEHPADMCGEW